MVIPDRILGCLTFATFGELLELAGSLPDATVLRAEVATSSGFRDAKAVSLETPVLMCQCRGFYFYSDLPTPSKVSIKSNGMASLMKQNSIDGSHMQVQETVGIP